MEAHTHEFMATAHDDQKFGFSLSSGAADEAVRRVLACPGLTSPGCTRTSARRSSTPPASRWPRTGCWSSRSGSGTSTGCEIGELDLGGGFGIAYTDEDDPPEIKVIAQNLREIVDGQCRGRRAAPAAADRRAGPRHRRAGHQVRCTRSGTVKDVDGLRTYVSVDGGMSDNIRTALYDAEYTCVLASRASAAPPMLSRVVGRHCESGDIVVRDAYLPADLVAGDLLAVAGHRGVLPVDGQQLQPRAAARGGGGPGRRRPA